MELHYLHIFNTVAKFESFTKASDSLHISQSALSIQIKKLEDELCLKLFDKAGNKIVLNENGKILYEYTKKIFQLTQEAEHILLDRRSAIGGTIVIGGSNTPGTYILPGILGAFKALYPQVNLDLYIGSTDEIAHLVEEGLLDFAINGGKLVYSNVVTVHKLKDDPLMISTSPQWAYSSKPYLEPKDLADAPFIVHGINSQLCKEIESLMSSLGIKPKIAMRLGSIDAIKQAVAANLGISLIPYSAVALELKTEQIKAVALKNYVLVYPYNLIYNKHRYLSPATLKLIDFVKNYFPSV